MKTSTRLVAIGIGALLIGVLLAYPLLTTNLNYAPPKNSIGRVRIGVDVVYAYFALDPNQTDTGFWQSYGLNAEAGIVNYLIILNVTNYSNETVYMDHFDVDAAESYYSVNNQTTVISDIRSPFLECSRETTGEYDRLHQVAPAATRWESGESRLVAFSGTDEITNTTLLRTGSFYIGGEAEGAPINGVASQAYGVGSKLIETTISGNEFIYNNLLFGNEILHFEYDGQIAYVGEG
ncbi:MAG: hypothetical protein ABSG33_03035 [Candidatus Bathyarchaeia archaeon]|jgi:hypothetical protein